MNALLIPVLAVMFLTEPDEALDAAAARAIFKDADRVALPGGEKGKPKGGKAAEDDDGRHAHVSSEMSDFDRQAGLAMFEGSVTMTYSGEYVLCADRLWAFMNSSNRMSRVVAMGNVSITNDTRVGTCHMAVYRRARGEIEMFWDGTNALARLEENGDETGALSGSRIRFWIDSEQVEVDNSDVESQQGGQKKLL